MSSAPRHWAAAVLREVGRGLDIQDVHRPELKRGQVLVKLSYSGVCRSQLMEVRGLRGEDRWLPHLLGHEGVGVVVEVGPGVIKVRDGDRVILGWIAGVGIDAPPPVFKSTQGETINAGPVTTFAQYSVVSENRVYLAPEGVSEKTAVLFGCALLTGMGMALREVNIGSDDQVLINGAGGVGLAALLGALSRGARVVVADPDPAKRELATQLGAIFAFDPRDSDHVEAFTSAYPDGVDTAIDSSGRVEAIQFAFTSLKYGGGTLVFASHPPAGEDLRLDPHDLIRGRQIRGSWGGSSRPDTDIPLISRLLQDRGLDLSFMTPQTYSLDQINQAIADLDAGRGLRPVVEMHPEN
jgi:S-(hydroxymethyl)glutathione dehydrogenase / alcohol dehydrogenase